MARHKFWEEKRSCFPLRESVVKVLKQAMAMDNESRDPYDRVTSLTRYIDDILRRFLMNEYPDLLEEEEVRLSDTMNYSKLIKNAGGFFYMGPHEGHVCVLHRQRDLVKQLIDDLQEKTNFTEQQIPHIVHCFTIQPQNGMNDDVVYEAYEIWMMLHPQEEEAQDDNNQ